MAGRKMRKWREEAGRLPAKVWTSRASRRCSSVVGLHSIHNHPKRREAKGSSIQPLLPSLVGWIVVEQHAGPRGVILMV
jgi:hypothetical protein